MAKHPVKKASQEDWHPAQILAALHMRGITLRALAKHHGLTSSSTLSRAMLHSYPANERRLAEAAGVAVQEMFPTRYFPDGTPRPRGIRGALNMESTAAVLARNVNRTDSDDERLAA